MKANANLRSRIARQRAFFSIKEFICDPKPPNLPDVMLADPARRDEIIRASLRAPIMVENVNPDQLDRLLPILAKGRFILSFRSPK